MKRQTEAVSLLREYRSRKAALANIPEQIKALEAEFTGIKSATTDGTPVSGTNSNKREERLLNNIARRDSLKLEYEIAARLANVTERGLDVLNERERRILDVFFIDRPANHVQLLCDEFFVEKTKLYTMKDEALNKFTRACYGVVEL